MSGHAPMPVRTARVGAFAALALTLVCGASWSLPAAAQPAAASSSEVTVTRGLELLEEWDIEGAEALVRALEKRLPDDPGTKFLAGRVAFEQGDYERAVELLGEALGPRAKESHDYELAVSARDQAKGTVVEESAHFTVRYKPGKDAALVPYTLATMEAAYDALKKDLGYAPPGKVRIEIYGAPRVLARVSSLSEEAIRTTGTIALCKYNRLMVTSPRALLRGYEWQDTLVHEYVHLVISRMSRNRVPIWLHEGIAKYLETRWRGPAGLALDPGSEALLGAAVKKDRLIPFERMHPSIALLPSQEDAALAFAEVFTAIEYIDKKGGPGALRKLIESLRDGKDDKQSVALATGGTWNAFESGWKKALKARPPSRAAPHIEKLVFRDEKQKLDKKERQKAYERGELGLLPDENARKHAHLGELLRARNRLGPAAVEYEKAISLVGPTHAALARKYALTKLALGQGADAEKVLRASLKEEPDDATNNLLLGRVLVQTGRAADARDHFLIANQRDPFDEEIHAGLIEVARATGDKGLEARERDVLAILAGEKLTWRAVRTGDQVATGYLRIESPVGARVFIDGVDTGMTVPLAEHPLTSGDHVVRLEPREGEPIQRTVRVPPDELVSFPTE